MKLIIFISIVLILVIVALLITYFHTKSLLVKKYTIKDKNVLNYDNEKYQIVKKVFTYILGTFFLLEIVSNGTFLSMACLLVLVGSLFDFNGKKENKNEN